MVSSMMADTMSPSAALSAFTAFDLLTPACGDDNNKMKPQAQTGLSTCYPGDCLNGAHIIATRRQSGCFRRNCLCQHGQRRNQSDFVPQSLIPSPKAQLASQTGRGFQSET